jgi:hypothetical protein
MPVLPDGYMADPSEKVQTHLEHLVVSNASVYGRNGHREESSSAENNSTEVQPGKDEGSSQRKQGVTARCLSSDFVSPMPCMLFNAAVASTYSAQLQSGEISCLFAATTIGRENPLPGYCTAIPFYCL